MSPITTSKATPPAAPPAIAPTLVLLPLPVSDPCGVAVAVTTYTDVSSTTVTDPLGSVLDDSNVLVPLDSTTGGGVGGGAEVELGEDEGEAEGKGEDGGGNELGPLVGGGWIGVLAHDVLKRVAVGLVIVTATVIGTGIVEILDETGFPVK